MREHILTDTAEMDKLVDDHGEQMLIFLSRVIEWMRDLPTDKWIDFGQTFKKNPALFVKCACYVIISRGTIYNQWYFSDDYTQIRREEWTMPIINQIKPKTFTYDTDDEQPDLRYESKSA